MMLRPYQIDLVARLSAELGTHPSVVLQLPTGGGKTHIAAHVARTAAAEGRRVWLIAHRREIVRQTSRSMADLGVPHAVVGTGHPFVPDAAVQVCAIGSLARRADGMPPPDLVIWDEAHHVAARSWSRLRARFPDARHLGLTATPCRLDGKGLDTHFDALVCGPSTADLMAAGHLSRYRLFAPTIPDLRGVGTRAGDYARDDLAERMSGATLVGDVVEHYQRLAAGCRAVAFAVSVEASRAVVARFTAADIPAAHVDGTTPGPERDAAIADLEAGRIRVLSNVEVFTEGFDLPAIDAVILLRPTRSFALFRQMVGRGLRTASGKGPTILLDHAGLVYDHDLPDEPVEWTLAGVKKRKGAAALDRLRRCPECSAVHAFAATCPECGHAYTSADRTIREVYGELAELRGRNDAPPKGFETIRGFARLIGKKYWWVRLRLRQGLPQDALGFIPVSEGLKWLRELDAPKLRDCTSNATKPIPQKKIGLSIRAFAREAGTSYTSVMRGVARGMPVETDGSINRALAYKWRAENPTRIFAKAEGVDFEAIGVFAKRLGLSSGGGARSLRKRGLPFAQNGLVHVPTGLAWVAKHGARARQFHS